MQEFTAREYLKIDIANNFGHDKLNWDERIDWFDSNEPQLEKLVKEAEEPALYMAGVQAWRDVQAGKPIGYPISLDACSSGLQLLACLTHDVSAAKLCGVISTGKREDAYTGIYQLMNDKLGTTGRIERSHVKRAVMTSLYGSEAVPTEVFGEGELLQCFLTTMNEAAPYAWELNQQFLAMWDPEATIHSWVMPDNFHVHVKVMGKVEETVHFLNQPFKHTRYINKPKAKGRSLGANTVHSLDGLVVREMVRRCAYSPDQIEAVKLSLINHGRDVAATYSNTVTDNDTRMVLTLWDHYQQSGYLSARILDHINDLNARYVDRAPIVELIASLPKKPFQLLTIHDAFRCLPSYGNDLRKQYTHQLVLIAKSKMLPFLLSQILQRPVTYTSPCPDMWQLVEDAEYTLS